MLPVGEELGSGTAQHRQGEERAPDCDERDRRDPRRVDRLVRRLAHDEASAGRQEREPEEELEEVGGVTVHHPLPPLLLSPKIVSIPPGS